VAAIFSSPLVIAVGHFPRDLQDRGKGLAGHPAGLGQPVFERREVPGRGEWLHRQPRQSIEARQQSNSLHGTCETPTVAVFFDGQQAMMRGRHRWSPQIRSFTIK